MTPHHRHRPGSARAALSYRDFRLVWLGLFASNVGTWMQNFTLPAYIDQRTESAALVGLLVFTQLGPLLVLSIPAGVFADRFPRRPYIVTMQALQMVGSVTLAVLVATEQPLWTLFAVSLAIGAGNAMTAPAFQSSIPMLVDRRDLAGAVSLNSISLNGSRVLGPGLAALLALAGASTAHLFLVNAATYLFMITALLVVHIPDVRGSHAERGWRRLLTGFRIARSRRVLSRSLATMSIFSLLCLPFVGLFPSVARRNFGIVANSTDYRVLYTIWGLGALAGALAVGTVLSQVDRRRVITFGFVLFAVTLGAFALIRAPGPAYPVAFAVGFAYFLVVTPLITVVQENLADTERAVVMPLWFMAFGGSVPVGNLVFGPVIDAIGARWVLGLGVVVALGLARWCDLRRLAPDDFLAHDATSAPAVTGGPVTSAAVAGN